MLSRRMRKANSSATFSFRPEVQFIFDSVAEKTKNRFSEFVMDDGTLFQQICSMGYACSTLRPGIRQERCGRVRRSAQGSHYGSREKSKVLADKLSARVTPVSTDVLKTDAPSNKGLVSKYVAGTFESLSEEQQARFEARVTSIIEAVESEPELLSDD
jgi:hypothetical protein